MAFDLDAAKTCKKCGVEKKVADFYFNKKKGYYYTTCKECAKERRSLKIGRGAVYFNKHKEDVLLLQKARAISVKLGLAILSPVRNGNTQTTVDDYGGFMIVNSNNGTIEAGSRYDLYPEAVFNYMVDVAKDRGIPYGKGCGNKNRSKKSRATL